MNTISLDFLQVTPTYQIQLQIGSILNPHQPLSVRALTLQERKLAFVIFPFIIEETKDSAGPPSGSNGKSDSCEEEFLNHDIHSQSLQLNDLDHSSIGLQTKNASQFKDMPEGG
ncbi:hypothetical protein MRB53_035133 [Persea americana]|uniref:Uncharacterized protein n=1 Tax=Persea americana TaxID=3435 RepID=A0ACC2K3Q3_PERAE|nr:hypothetical protein MRB53_035133 [Persea americana]